MVSYDISLPAKVGSLNDFTDIRADGTTFVDQIPFTRTTLIGETVEDNYITEDYLYVMGESFGVALIPGFYKILQIRFQDGWDQWSFIGASIGAPFGSDHATCDALAISMLGMDCPSAYDLYWPILGIPGLTLGTPCDIFVPPVCSGAVFNSPAPTLREYSGTANFSISNLPAPSDPQYGSDYSPGNGGPLEGELFVLTGQPLDGDNVFYLDNDIITNNGLTNPNVTYKPNQAFRLSFNTSWLDRDITVNSVESILDFKAMSRTMEMPAGTVFWTNGGEPEPVLAIAGNRYGLTNRDHGFAVNPRRSRG